MRFVLSIFIFALLIYGGSAEAQDSKLGTTRSEDLQLKAKIEYEKRNQKQPQQIQKPAPTSAPVARPAIPSEGLTGKPEATIPTQQNVPAAGPSGALVSDKSVTCKHGAEVRELYIENKGLGCELFYTKAGNPKSQARQNNGKNICESVFDKMKATLEKTGFVCEQKTN